MFKVAAFWCTCVYLSHILLRIRWNIVIDSHSVPATPKRRCTTLYEESDYPPCPVSGESREKRHIVFSRSTTVMEQLENIMMFHISVANVFVIITFGSIKSSRGCFVPGNNNNVYSGKRRVSYRNQYVGQSCFYFIYANSIYVLLINTPTHIQIYTLYIIYIHLHIHTYIPIICPITALWNKNIMSCSNCITWDS